MRRRHEPVDGPWRIDSLNLERVREDADRIGLVVIIGLQAKLAASCDDVILQLPALGPALHRADEHAPPRRHIDREASRALGVAIAFAVGRQSDQDFLRVSRGVARSRSEKQRLLVNDQIRLADGELVMKMAMKRNERAPHRGVCAAQLPCAERGVRLTGAPPRPARRPLG